MKQSKLFLKTNRNVSKDETSMNARLLEQAGYVDKLMAGVYSYMPLGLRVLRKIEQVVREEMDAIGGQEVLMGMLHPKALWEQTGAWDNVDVLFKIQSRTEKEYALGQSEEEVVTPLVLSRYNTYKELPMAVYQIHWKFRDELRAKSGVMRGREFMMKDMYSFHTTQEDFDRFYQIAKEAYLKIYTRLGLTAKVTEASGGSFSEKISYEFMVLTDAGEDDILYCDACDFCVNTEIAKVAKGDNCPKCSKSTLQQAKASEVGNVFDLGQKYGTDFGLQFVDENNERKYPIMGCYGIGITRLIGVIVEKYNDEKGIIWPEAVAPFTVHLVSLSNDLSDEVSQKAELLYQNLQAAGLSVLYDDRAVNAGEKFADSDLIGIPYRVVISAKTLAENKVELKQRSESDSQLISETELLEKLK